MSQRAIKRQVTEALYRRNRASVLLAHYEAVLADIECADARTALNARMQAIAVTRDRAQAEAEQHAAQLTKPKQTFSGLWLHERWRTVPHPEAQRPTLPHPGA